MSEQQMDKMREEFEAWWMENMNTMEMDLHRFADGYSCHDTNRGWMAWKASRASLSENHSPDIAKMVVPEGWQLVPVEPTEAMISSVIDAGTFDEDDVAYFWDSMLAAAPKLRD